MSWILSLPLAQLGTQAAETVGRGRIEGGWGYVWASYAITWGALAGYGLFLWLRRPPSRQEDVK
jgi:hypothetical protein